MLELSLRLSAPSTPRPTFALTTLFRGYALATLTAFGCGDSSIQRTNGDTTEATGISEITLRDPLGTTGVMTEVLETGEPTTASPNPQTTGEFGTSTLDTNSTTDSTLDPSSGASGESSTSGEMAVCGDKQIQVGEKCDDGGENGTYEKCNVECTGKGPRCGDGEIQQNEGETCDDGNLLSSDACTSKCQPATCGDGFIQALVEACDDGNQFNTDACTEGCQNAKCGDGHIQAGVEVCDDGVNDGAYGGCMPGCEENAPRCGDNIVQKDQGEQCDDQMGLENVGSIKCMNKCHFDLSKVKTISNAGVCPGGDDKAKILCMAKLGTETVEVIKTGVYGIGENIAASPGLSCVNNLEKKGHNVGGGPGLPKDLYYFPNLQESGLLGQVIESTCADI